MCRWKAFERTAVNSSCPVQQGST